MSLRKYLRELGGSKPIMVKSSKLEKLAGAMCPEKIEDFFISEYSKKNGQHVFNSLWFFSQKYWLESKRLMSSEYNLDINCMYGNIDLVEITYEHYDPLKPSKTTDDSKLRMEGNCGVATFDFVATKSNCTKLWSMFLKYVKPNLVETIERE